MNASARASASSGRSGRLCSSRRSSRSSRSIVRPRRRLGADGGDPDGGGAARLSAARNRPKRLGVDFVHQAPTFDAQLEHIMPQVAAMGASVAVADFDRDGWQDLYVTNSAEGSLNRLYRNKGDGTFADVARGDGRRRCQPRGHRRVDGRALGRLRQRRVRGSVPLQVRPARALPQRWRKSVRARLRARRPARHGSTPTRRSGGTTTATDGSTCSSRGYWADDIDLWHLKTTRIMPESFEYAENGGRKYLFRNRGDGTFEETSAALGIQSRRWTLAAGGRRSVGLGLSGSVPRQRLRRLAALSSTTAASGSSSRAETTGVGRTPKSGMNASFGDIFNDGRLSIYKTNISEPGVLVQANDLWVPKARAAGAALEFENLASTLGVDLGGWSWGAQFGDLNNDGTLDMYLVNGYVSAGERTSYWYDFAEIAVGHNAHHRRRRELAADARAQPLRLSAQARLDRTTAPAASRKSRRTSAPATRSTAARSRSRISRIAACSTSSSPISAGRCSSTRTRSARAGTGLRSSSKARRATAARLARASNCTGTDSGRCRKSAAAAVSAHRTSAGCITGSAPSTAVDRVVIRWPSGRTRDDRAAGRSIACIA